MNSGGSNRVSTISGLSGAKAGKRRGETINASSGNLLPEGGQQATNSNK